MPNKYIIHGATYNGNGTSSAEATSNGGVGAWNNINVFEGTAPAYGSLVAGDTVFIRSKDVSGNNLVRTLSATVTLGSAAATSSAWVTWVLDNGAVWPGIDGTLTYNCPSGYVVNASSNNNYVSATQDALRVVETNAAADYKNYWAGSDVKTSGLFNNVAEADDTQAYRTYPYTAAIEFQFDAYLQADAGVAKFWIYDAATYPGAGATLLTDASGNPMSGTITGPTASFSYAWASNKNWIGIAVGDDDGKIAEASGTIVQSTGNVGVFNAGKERWKI